MEINVLFDEGLEDYLELDWLQTVAERVLTIEGAVPEAELGLVIAGKDKVQQLNFRYLGRNEPTDVLAFSMLPQPVSAEETDAQLPPFVPPPDGLTHLGEVIVSYHQAVIQAEEHRHSVKTEMAILVIHGILHLLGYDHDKPELERQMRARESEILSSIEREI